MLTLIAWDFDENDIHQEIDAFAKSIPFEETENKVNVVENGTNGIGQFNYFYRIQNFGSKIAMNVPSIQLQQLLQMYFQLHVHAMKVFQLLNALINH